MSTLTSLADRGQRLGMRLLTRAGGLPLMSRPEVRSRVEKVLYLAAREGFKAAAAQRRFTHRPGTGAPRRAPAVRARSVFDLSPTEDQEMLRAAARELADEVVRPAAALADSERRLPDAVREAGVRLGLTGLAVPVELGGIAEERSAVSGVLVLEELARGDLGIAFALMAPAAVAAAIAAYGDAGQQQTYLPHLTGETPPLAALALQEPQPLFDPLAPRTTGRPEGDDLVLDGVKALVPGAAAAELYVVSALVEGRPRLVVVEAGTPGLVTEDDPAMGLRAAGTGRVRLAGVRVPRTNLLGTEEDHLDCVRRARLAWAAAAVGTGQAVLDQLTTYTKQRTAFGEPIAHRQAVAFTVADVAIELAGLRLVVWRAAARLDAGLDASAQVAQARQLTARHGAWIGSSAVQMLGGHGFVKEFDNERWYRDLRGAGVLEGALLV